MSSLGFYQGNMCQMSFSKGPRGPFLCLFPSQKVHSITARCSFTRFSVWLPLSRQIIDLCVNHALSSYWVLTPATGSTNQLERFTVNYELVQVLLHSSLMMTVPGRTWFTTSGRRWLRDLLFTSFSVGLRCFPFIQSIPKTHFLRLQMLEVNTTNQLFNTSP